MNYTYEQAEETAAFINPYLEDEAYLAITLGSGFDACLGQVKMTQSIPYSELPHFPVTSVMGHQGILHIGKWAKKHVLIWSGRFHYYEGHSMQTITFPVRVTKLLGIHDLLLTNAAGGLLESMQPGSLMFIRDHINYQPENPLRGPHDPRWGPRFPDMNHVYDSEWITSWSHLAKQLNIPYHIGVYLGLQGPSLETPAEYSWFHQAGAHAVGMSTVPEAIVARQMGMRIGGISIISNVFNPYELTETTHEGVLQVVRTAADRTARLISQWLG
ncbi:MAG: purine-nucleoside phosphorylase [Lewinellaceae bacterium]|nr:purine-nucleoside phosphorylase [Lewinellaceae bacterium]